MPKLFGTDGVRGVANADLTPELVLDLGLAAGTLFSTQLNPMPGVPAREKARPAVVMARDTRVSGPLLQSALAAGLMSAGADVLMAGVLPTPAVAYLIGDLAADAGAVISGSHNPPEDNGIKFFGRTGHKLNDEEEQQIESMLGAIHERPTGDELGTLIRLTDAEERYVGHALNAIEGRRLKGLRIVIDCANGASYRTSPRAFELAGAEVAKINIEPDGTNINVESGSTHPEIVAEAVLDFGADLGLAHDGDADRVIAVDELGRVVDGDAIMAILAFEMKEQDRLAHDSLVATVMANLGFRRAMAEAVIKVVEAPVGDRYVIEAMLEHGLVLGGEQSGHIIMSEFSTTGDGLITALRLAARMSATGQPLSDLASVIRRYPQVLINVRVGDASALEGAERVWEEIRAAEAALGDSGRVLVRPSGTEPVVRVMVEADTEEKARSSAEKISSMVEQELGGEA